MPNSRNPYSTQEERDRNEYQDLDTSNNCCGGNKNKCLHAIKEWIGKWSGAVYAPLLLLSALTTLPYTTIANQYIHFRLALDMGDDLNRTDSEVSSTETMV